ncbi:MAG: TIGR04282 family arsenosugar biosynthesis glycosyltransferase [Flavobacteriaceae bacterium]
MGLFTTNDTGEDYAEDVFHFPTSSKLLLIFTRNPELGKCKTRLATKIGAEKALEIYKFLLKHTVSVTQNLNTDKRVYYTDEIWPHDLWDPKVYTKKLQAGDHLGSRMEQAFREGFQDGYQKIIIIGSDMYDLSQSDLEAAFTALNSHDFVLGPATDGGYYLLGMKKPWPQLFSEKQWGSNSVLKDTLSDLRNERFVLLPERNDVDVYEDIAHLKAFQPFLKHLHHD